MNYLGIDYGRKRVGVSIFHGQVGIVLPMPAILSNDDGEKIEKILHLVRSQAINEIAIGYPLNMDGSVGHQAREVDLFVAKLSSKLGNDIKIHRVDERLTSEQAAQDKRNFMGQRERQSSKKNKKNRMRGEVDSCSATIILQDFVDEAVLRTRI